MRPQRKLISVDSEYRTVDAHIAIQKQVEQMELDGYVKDGDIFTVGLNRFCQAMVLPEVINEELKELVCA